MFLRPDERPRTVLARVLGLGAFGIVVLAQAALQVVRVADIELAGRILDDIDPEWPRFLAQTPRVGLEPTT